MALALVKLLIVGLSTLTTCASAVLFKGAAVLVVVLLRLAQLPGLLVAPLLCAVRAATAKAFAAAFAASAGILAQAVAAASSNSAAVEAAKGRPEAVVAAAAEVAAYAWEVAKHAASNSTASLFDAVRFVAHHARA